MWCSFLRDGRGMTEGLSAKKRLGFRVIREGEGSGLTRRVTGKGSGNVQKRKALLCQLKGQRKNQISKTPSVPSPARGSKRFIEEALRGDLNSERKKTPTHN